LPGGEAAVREPRRSALGCGFALLRGDVFGNAGAPFLRPFGESELRLLRQGLELGINAPVTSSAGRLFDAVASILNLRQVAAFEGQAAMDVEFAAGDREGEPYPFLLVEGEPAVIDWAPLFLAILDDLAAGAPTGLMAARFHESLVEMMVAVALREGIEEVVFTGGVFQNRRLTGRLAERLRSRGFRPHWPRLVPPNDGGIAFGQVVALAWSLDGSTGIVHDTPVTRRG
jgi:hydrogenase maturation protein HypF